MKPHVHIFSVLFFISGIAFSAHNYFNICTAANTIYFQHLLNLIGSIHKVNFDELNEIAVFDLGLTDQEKAELASIKKVSLHKLEKTHPHILNYFFLPNGRGVLGWFAWKPVVLKQALDLFPSVLWLDAGTTVLRPLDILLKHIEQNNYFLGTIGDETDNGIYRHPIKWGTTKIVCENFKLYHPDKQWILQEEYVMGNIIGISRNCLEEFVIPLYELTKDLRNFEDDGTTPDGYGTGRHDQTLISILAYSKNLMIFKQDYTQAQPFYLTVDNQQVPFYITWHGGFVNNNTYIYSSRGDLSRAGFFTSFIKYK